ncbi:MAG TPA: hypothetical protein VGB71_10060 [Flavisolibacter sp.]|jgi:hypothetical protein
MSVDALKKAEEIPLKNIKVSTGKKLTGWTAIIKIAPKKAYISLRRKKQVAIIQLFTKFRLGIGLNLKSTEPTGALELVGSWNTICPHWIKIEKTTG